jgi:hypothetical protein
VTRPRIRRWFSWKVWDAQSAAVVLERQEKARRHDEAAQQRGQQDTNRAAAFHRWQLDCVPHFLREAGEVAGITPETPHTEAWAEYLRWCQHYDFQPLGEREFAQERSLYR